MSKVLFSRDDLACWQVMDSEIEGFMKQAGMMTPEWHGRTPWEDMSNQARGSVAMLVSKIMSAERERAAMICHQYRDWSDNPAEAIATAILGK
jgi:hypothetical protein